MENQRYETGIKRLGAAIVDAIVFMPFLLVSHWLLSKTDNNFIITAWTIFTALVSLFYSIFAHHKYGQTIGKWVAGVKVLDVSETKNITLRQSIFRDSFYLVTEIIGLGFFIILFFETRKAESIFIDYRNFADYSLLLWTAIELLSMLTNSKRRAVHDFLAKSVVVRT